MMKVSSIVGARPNFTKLAALEFAFRKRPEIQHVIIHTGQHYDELMSSRFFEDLEIREPDYQLNVGSGSQAEQVGRTMMALEPVLAEERPDWVVVMGDVNATIATAVVAKKMSLRLAHVEAGLRSFNWAMPEEINRVVTDRLADLLFVSEPSGLDNLRAEAVEEERLRFVGNVMIDTLMRCLPIVERRDVAGHIGVSSGEYVTATIHRPSNTDSPERLRAWMLALEDVAARLPVVFPVHPRTREKLGELRYEPRSAELRLIEPLGYLDMLALMKNARVVLTDSGGMQEEATALGVACLTLRDETERPVTIQCGTNRLVGSNPDRLPEFLDEALRAPLKHRMPEKWDGKAAERIAEELLSCRALPLRGR